MMRETDFGFDGRACIFKQRGTRSQCPPSTRHRLYTAHLFPAWWQLDMYEFIEYYRLSALTDIIALFSVASDPALTRGA